MTAAAMVLSAGFGTRLRPLTDELAKPLVPIGDRPMLAHVVETLAGGGIGKVVVNTHHRASDFDSLVGTLETDLHIVHEPNILGTAGGVSNAARELGDADVVVWNGDILAPDLDVRAAIEQRAKARVAMLWIVEPRPAGAGTVGLDRAANVVRLRGERFGEEVSGGDFLGVQVLSAALRATLPREGCLVADVALPLLRRGGIVASFSFTGPWDDVGTPQALLRANLRWLDRHGLDSWCASDARVAAGVRLERTIVGARAVVSGAGPARECVVWPGAELRAPRERAIVGRDVEVVVPPDPGSGA